MNETIKQLQDRRSVREFTGENIKEKDLQAILYTAQRAANSVNGQQTSLIVIRDKQKLEKIAELCGGQKHIAEASVFVFVVMDFYRGVYAAESVGKRNIGPLSADGILVGAIDAGIVVNALQAAIALGYGTTVIGAIRKNSKEIIKMLGLPKYVFPLIGSTIGVPAERPLTRVKPRVPLDTFAFEDKYDAEKVKEGVEFHEKDINEWRKENGTPQLPSYKEMIVRIYENFYNESKKELEEQGFKFADKLEEE
jgi:nitroreductase